ncbi:MAG: hypothetical protein ABW174_05660 [Flavitalea sp.]
MKYSQWIGVLVTLGLIATCFFPWTYYPDLGKSFTGFFSEDSVYGKPGKVFIFLGVFAIVFFLIPRVWAKRWNFLFAALILAYGIKSYILYTGCYNGICPQKLAGIFIMLLFSVLVMVMAVIPDTKVKREKED